MRLIRVRLVLVNLNPINDTYIHITFVHVACHLTLRGDVAQPPHKCHQKRLEGVFGNRQVPADVTSEGQGDVTCDSLGGVTWSHCIHDVRDLSGRSEGSRKRKPHQKSQKLRLCPVISRGGFYYRGFE